MFRVFRGLDFASFVFFCGKWNPRRCGSFWHVQPPGSDYPRAAYIVSIYPESTQYLTCFFAGTDRIIKESWGCVRRWRPVLAHRLVLWHRCRWVENCELRLAFHVSPRPAAQAEQHRAEYQKQKKDGVNLKWKINRC